MFGAACEADARQLWGRERHGRRRKACGDNGHDVGEARHRDAERFDRHRCEFLRCSSVDRVCLVWTKACVPHRPVGVSRAYFTVPQCRGIVAKEFFVSLVGGAHLGLGHGRLFALPHSIRAASDSSTAVLEKVLII